MEWINQANDKAHDINEIISYMDERRSFILNEINPMLSVTTALPVVSGFPRSTQSNLSLSGEYNLIDTSTVSVSGKNAILNPSAGTWSVDDIILIPGINRLTIEAANSEGAPVDSQIIDIWYEIISTIRSGYYRTISDNPNT